MWYVLPSYKRQVIIVEYRLVSPTPIKDRTHVSRIGVGREEQRHGWTLPAIIRNNVNNDNNILRDQMGGKIEDHEFRATRMLCVEQKKLLSWIVYIEVMDEQNE